MKLLGQLLVGLFASVCFADPSPEIPFYRVEVKRRMTHLLALSTLFAAVNFVGIDNLFFLSSSRFTVVSYLRTRLEKIERFAPWYFTSTGLENDFRRLLTPDEFNFAKSVWDLTKQDLETSALQHMPRIFRDIKADMLPKPNVNRFVFFRANDGCPDVLLDPEDDEPIRLEKDSLHLTRYGPIGGLLKTGRVQLI